MLLEQKLAKERGWVEFSVYPLYSPQCFIAEGSANYGIELAFPGEERLASRPARLYPLAGLPTRDAGRYLRLHDAMEELAGRPLHHRPRLSGRPDQPRAGRSS